MKLTIIKHFLKHKLLLSRSIKAIAGNLIKLFLIDKLAFLVPERFRKLFKILCMFGAKFTLISTLFGIIYSILAEIFNWTFNYKIIIDLILGLLLSLETGLFSELKVIFTYYYVKFFDWWISKIESTDKTRAKSLRERIFKNENISVGPIDSKEKARMNKEYLDNLKKQVNKDNESWHQRMVREIKELNDKNRTNLNINITPNYSSLNSWISLDTMKWLMYTLIAAGIIYSYYSFFSTINTFFSDSFLTLYNSLKDFIQNPLTYLSGATGYLYVNGKELLKRYLLRRFWPFTLWFGKNRFSREDRDDATNNNTQGENNYPTESLRELIGSDIPSMEETDLNTPIKPNYDNYKSKEDYDRITNEQADITQRWKESKEDFELRKGRIEAGIARAGDLSSESETISEAKERYFKSPSPEPNTSQNHQAYELLLKYNQMTEDEYINSLHENLLEFIEDNKDNDDPRIQSFIKWATGKVTYEDLKTLVNKIPKNFSDEWLQTQYDKFFYEFIEVETFKDLKDRLTKSLIKK